MNEIDTNTLLLQMRAMAARASGLEAPAASAPAGADFKSLLHNALDQVNEAQKTAQHLSTAFERGAPDTDIAEVMIALQKANVSFQAITQVRNRLVAAYQDIMNMPI